ncbi:sigma-70 family RNA polymerase sigma factor [Tautonia sp. JC769]|uniref:sigma-70 family RNA polymerase sigma factor n=1 Tax=Tautonia sp. JC769 TaxID=3232135 RepID=UPI003458B2E1
MSRRITGRALEDLGRVFTIGAIGRLSDGELLARFLDRDGKGGEEAFAALVERHGPTVLGVCRRLLGDPHEADDAFQATFLVLARRAASLSGRDRVGNWLYGVALRVSREARRRADRRRRRERLLGDEAEVIPSAGSVAVGSDRSVEELRRLIVEELARLPDRYRGPLLLCDLEGRSRREAADRLGLAEGTLSSRLARGRDLLRGRLVRRGLAPSAVIAALGRPAAAGVPASLVRRTAEAAWIVTTRGVAAGAVPAAVSGLAGEVLRTMFFYKLTAGLAAVGLAASVAIGAAWAIGPRGGGPPVAPLAVTPVTVVEDEPGEDEDTPSTIARGVVVDEEGRPVAGAEVTVFLPVEERGTGVSDAEGQFAIAAPGRNLGGHPVVASAGDRGRLGFAVYDWQKAQDGEEEILQVILKPSREVVIRAEDGEGRPVEGATIELFANLTPIVRTRSDADGLAPVRLPADAPIAWAVGLKSGVGFDYAELGPERNRGTKAADLPGAIDLSLDGARTVKLKAVDRRGEPLEGVDFYTWLIMKAGKREVANLGGSQSFHATTGADGIATFDWIPAVTAQPIQILSRSEGYHAPDRAMIGPEAASGATITAEFLRNGTIRGRVTHADGSPAGGIEITGHGSGWGFGSSVEGQTEEDGSFEFSVEAMHNYIIGVIDEEWAAPSRAGIVVEEGQTVDGIDFTLGRGAVIRGTVTIGPDARPEPGAFVQLIESGGAMPEYLRREGDRTSRVLQLVRFARTGEQGAYRFRVGPGSFTLVGLGRGARSQTVDAVEGEEYVVDFRMERPERGPFAGRVALAADPSKGLEGLLVQAVPANQSMQGHFTLSSGEDGRFDTERYLDRLEILARNQDWSLGGILRVSGEDDEVTILVGPTASASGIALDTTGEPLANQGLHAGTEVYQGDPADSPPLITAFSPEVTTDAEGRFSIKGMVPGREYRISHYDGEYYQHIATITPVEPGQIDLGTVRVGSPRPGQEDAMSSFLRDAPDAGDEAPAIEATTLDGEPLSLEEFRGKYILVDFWATWCGPCIAEIPTMEAVFAEFGEDEQFVMLSLSIDEEIEAPRAFQADRRLPWAQGFVGEGIRSEVLDAFGVRAIPALVLIGPDGTIVARGMRGDQIREAVAKALTARE